MHRTELRQLLESGSRDDSPGRAAFYARIDSAAPIVIFGAGNLGRRIHAAARAKGITVAAFADNNPALWNSEIDGLRVVAPANLLREFGDTVAYVVSLWHPCKRSDVCAVTAQLIELGCDAVSTFPVFLWRYAPEWLPELFWSTPEIVETHAQDVLDTYSLLADEASRRAYVNAVRLKLLADFDAVNSAFPGPQYFPRDVYHVASDETFVDCGAFDGDTVSDFVTASRGRFRKIIAIEPDPANAVGLHERIQRLNLYDRIAVHRFAITAVNGTVPFVASGNESSAVVASGNVSVPSVALDSLLAQEQVTIVKMDIEGAESDALLGAAQTIGRDRPILAVCVYHRPSDLWQIPLRMRQLLPDAAVFLRQHCADGYETVCYAVPRERGIRPTYS